MTTVTLLSRHLTVKNHRSVIEGARELVVISGLPGSGKTTVGLRLAATLAMPLIDKDDILERLFESRGIGDAAWRRLLSREADEILEREVSSCHRAVVVSFWRLPGMSADSGTPIDWLTRAPNRVVNVHCACDPETAARRFTSRQRHRGHLDADVRFADVLANLRCLAELGPLNLRPRIDIDTTSCDLDLAELVPRVESALR